MKTIFRFSCGIILGIIIWSVTSSLNPFSSFSANQATYQTASLLSLLYIAVISSFTGFVTAIICGKYKVVVAMIPVFVCFGGLTLLIATHGPQDVWRQGAPYFMIILGICILFAALGGLMAKLLKIKLPLKL